MTSLSLSPSSALTLLVVFGATMMAAGAAGRLPAPAALERFLVAHRSVGVVGGAMSVAATWIWAPALFVASQKAYQQGMAGLFWFTAPNVACLVMFAFLAERIRAVFPRGYTLPEYISGRFDRKTHAAYLFVFLSLQVCSVAVQLIAGAGLLEALGGVPHWTGVLILTVIFTSYSLVGGLRSSIRTDILQMGIILAGMAILIPAALTLAGGLSPVLAGLGGKSGAFANPLDPHVAYTFGITVTIGLLAGPVADQQHWQRAFAFRPGAAFKGYILGAMLFATVPLGMGLLGFLAAGLPGSAPLVESGALPAQQVGAELIRHLLPSWATLLFLAMILSGLASTGDSALCAGASLAAVDLYRRYRKPDADEAALISVARTAIVVIAVVACLIALMPGITILGLFLFYGTLRSAVFLPTVLMLYSSRITSSGMFLGVAGAAAFGLPVYLAGEFLDIVHLKVVANIGMMLISGLIPLWRKDRVGREETTP